MSSDQPLAHLTLVVDPDMTQDDERRDADTRRLYDELRELDVESVDLQRAGAAPPGAKSEADMITLGALAITVLPTAIPQVIEFLKSWVMRGQGHTIKLKTQIEDRSLEVEYSPAAVSEDELNTLIRTMTTALTKGD